MKTIDELVQDIEDVEELLKSLRLDLEERRATPSERESGTLKIGDRVEILNPNPDQEKEGVISKINAVLLTIDTRKGKVNRLRKNIKKHD